MAKGLAGEFSWAIRPAKEDDVPSVLWLIQLLAENLKNPNTRETEEKQLLRDGFGDNPHFHVILAELTDGETPVERTPNPDLPSSRMPHNERLIAHALYFTAYSSWKGKILLVEDLFVRQEYRNHGIGTALMQECAKIAVATECARMQWQVQDWNTNAIGFYEGIGGTVEKEMLTVLMHHPELVRFASGEVSADTASSKSTK